MNVNDRKLFSNRGARNRLSQMSGIMTSSEPLMNEVQKFERGGGVNFAGIASGQLSDTDNVAEVSALIQRFITNTDPNFKEQIFGDARADITLEMAQDKIIEILMQRGYGASEASDLVSAASSRLLDPNLESSFRPLGETPNYKLNRPESYINRNYPELGGDRTFRDPSQQTAAIPVSLPTAELMPSNVNPEAAQGVASLMQPPVSSGSNVEQTLTSGPSVESQRPVLAGVPTGSEDLMVGTSDLTSPILPPSSPPESNDSGEVEQEYIINIPGFSEPGEYLRVKASTLMKLNDAIPDLMGQRDALVEEAQLIEDSVRTRPGDAVVGTRLNRLFEPSAPEAVASQDSVMFPGELSKAFVPQQDVQTEGFIPPTIGATELNTPAVRNAMAQPPSAGLATELMLAAQQGPAPDPNDEILAQARALLSDEANARIDSGDTQATIANALGPDSPLLEANQLASEELAAAAENEGFVPVTLNQGTMGMSVFDYNPETGAIRPRGGNAEIMLGGGSKAEANVQKMVIDQYNFDTNVQPQMEAERVAEDAQQRFEATGSGEFLDLAAKAARDAREIAAKEPEAPPSAVDQVLSRTKPFKDVPYALDEIEAQQLQKAEAAAKPEVVEAEAEAAAVETADEDVGGDQTTPDLTPEQRREAAENAGRSGPSNLEPIVEIANDPDLTPEEKSDKASNQIFTGLTGQEVNLSPKESVKAYEKMFSEMLGMKDKDAEKEMWHNMAMIGFAIAAGESPNALSNIANGLLAGTKMMKQDRATQQARTDKVKLAAMNRAFQLEDAETKFGRDLQLVGARNIGSDKYTSTRERTRLKELIVRSPFDYPALLDDSGQLDPSKLNTYLDQVVSEEITEADIPTQEQAIAEYKSVLKTKPELKSVMLTRLKNKGYDVAGLE